MFRFLTTTDDRKLLFSRLRKFSENTPRSSYYKGIPFISDYPRRWSADLNNLWHDSDLQAFVPDMGSVPTHIRWIKDNLDLAERDNSFMSYEKLIKTRIGLDETLSEAQKKTSTRTRLYDPCRFELAEGMTEEPNISDRCKPAAVQGMECHMEDIFWRVRALKASESDILRGLLQDCKNVNGFSVSHGVRMAVEGDKMLTRKTEYPNTVGEYPPTAIQRALDDADTTSLTTDLSPEGRIRRLSELKDTLHKVIWSNRVKIDNCFDKWGLKFFARVESEHTPAFERETILRNSEKTTKEHKQAWFNAINKEILKFKGQVWTSDFEEAFNGPDPTISFEDPTTTPSRTRNGAVYGNGGSAGSKRSTEDAGLHRHDNPVSTKRIKR
ncbi:uncharacterized protein IWZ02DRAFT_444193 [Phyllosticta citriasiana]|uniref:uncharacterized protein n=1 Tax=Phyllosticta citriasiana TaxID=595635 RepID=UPI0030FDA29E